MNAATLSGIRWADDPQVKGLEKKRAREIRGKAQSLSPTVFVGKDGLTEAVIAELVRQLKKNKLVKAKLQQSAGRDRMSIAEELKRRSGATLVEVRGRTMVFAKE